MICKCLWCQSQKAPKDRIAPGGVLIADPQARNRRINAAYAQLWLAAAEQFDRLLKNPTTYDQLRASIIKIASGGGIE